MVFYPGLASCGTSTCRPPFKGNHPTPGLFGACWTAVPDLEPRLRHPFRRRVPAHPIGHRTGKCLGRLAVHLGRTQHWSAPPRQRKIAGRGPSLAGCGKYRSSGRARRPVLRKGRLAGGSGSPRRLVGRGDCLLRTSFRVDCTNQQFNGPVLDRRVARGAPRPPNPKRIFNPSGSPREQLEKHRCCFAAWVLAGGCRRQWVRKKYVDAQNRRSGH